jgi:DHA2 family multidrug resistance protein
MNPPPGSSSPPDQSGPPFSPAAGRPPLTGASLALLTVALPLATFMQVIDATIANVAVPTMAGNLGVSSSQGIWVITSYGVSNAIVLPLTGRLAQRFGEVRLFLWSVVLFSLSSLCCGLATSLSFLVAARVVQGAVGGPMMPLAQALLLNNYPKERQVMAMALWSMTVSVAPVFGPILGGWISDNYHWGWIFFINVPVGALVFFLTRRLLAGRESSIRRPTFNLISFAFLALGVGAFQIMLDRGRELDWFGSNEIVALAVLAVAGIGFLIAWDLSGPSPLLDFSLFGDRNFSVGVALISLGMMIYLGTVVLLPLLLQTRFGYTATWAGLASAPVGLLPVLLTPVLGKYLNKVDLRLVITFGFLVFAYCMHLRTGFAPNADLRFVVWPQILQGLAMACFFVPITTLTFSGLKPRQMAGAAGLFNCIRTLFGAIGASVVTTLWERREALHHARLRGSVDPYNPLAAEMFTRLEGLGLTQEQAAAYIDRQISAQGFILAAGEMYQLCAAAFLVMIGLVWAARSTTRGGRA